MVTQSPLAGPGQPLNAEQLVRVEEVIGECTAMQLAWLSGYLWARANQGSVLPVADAHVLHPSVTIVSCSQTGNAHRLAEQLRNDLLAEDLAVNLVHARDYKFKQIDKEHYLIIVASTQGEGEPAEEAIALYKFLFSKKAPSLTATAFAVFGLGDSSYEKFCQSGKDFDARLAELGASRLLARVDGDVDYQDVADKWRQQLIELLKERLSTQHHGVNGAAQVLKKRPVAHPAYSKERPFVASLLVNQKITGRGSEKDVRHIEIDLDGSGLNYQPGDALGVWFENDGDLIDEFVRLLWLTGDEPVSVEGCEISLRDALRLHFELTQNTSMIVEKYAQLARDETLLALLDDKAKLQHYAHYTPIVDMVRQAPTDLTAQQCIDLLRPLTPRLYSIASSQAENSDEVHITVGVVRYQIGERARVGGASGFLADRLVEGGKLRVFVEQNDNFRLPDNPDTPIIMIGPGTGIAPFRAFMQQREAEGAQGKNWLFFGNPHFIEDFLYQLEWQRYVRTGLLTKIDLAWSRDQQEKVYVQDKLRERGAEIWRWLQQGAHIYVCGDANRMAKDVEQALLELIAAHSDMNIEQADEFLSELRLERRYQRDIY